MKDNFPKFECKVEDDTWEKGAKVFSFTLNGFQWTSIPINPSIAQKMKEAIDNYLGENHGSR